MKVSEKLQKRLYDELGLDVELPKRVPRGFHGRNAGTWAWSAKIAVGYGEIGSEDTMAECVKADLLETYTPHWDTSIHVCAECRGPTND